MASMSGLGAGISKFGGDTGAPVASMAGLGQGLSKFVPGTSTGVSPSPGTGDPAAPQGEVPAGEAPPANVFNRETIHDPDHWIGVNQDQGVDWNEVFLNQVGYDPRQILSETPWHLMESKQGGSWQANDIDLNRYDWSGFDPGLVTRDQLTEHYYKQQVGSGNVDPGEENVPAYMPQYGGLLKYYHPDVYDVQGYGSQLTASWEDGYVPSEDSGDALTPFFYADGGIVQDNSYEGQLTQGAIMALDPDTRMSEEDRQVILAEFEEVFGDGSVNELLAELEMGAAGPGRMVEGPGTGTSDSVPAVINGATPARLSDGEYVIKAADVEALGGEQGVEQLISAGIAQGVK